MPPSPPLDVTAYLERIAYSGDRRPNLATLTELMRQHLFTVPFENLDIAAGIPISLDQGALFDKIVRRRRGGFCYELNGLFAILLERLGFVLSRVACRVLAADGQPGREYDHLALTVATDGGAYLVDVGFGEGLRAPLLIRFGASAEEVGITHTLLEADPLSLHQFDASGARIGGYSFSTTRRRLDEFAAMCHYHQTSPDSHFTRGRICSLATRDGRLTVRDLHLIETAGGQRSERLLADDAERAFVLYKRFGIRP